MKPLYEMTTMVPGVIIIPAILYGIYTTRKELKRQNRNRERKEPISTRRGSQPVSPRKQVIVNKTRSVGPSQFSYPVVQPVYDPCKEWFITDWGMKSEPSSAEQRVINELIKYPLQWHREVSFNGFTTKQNGHYRFDFFIPSLRLCIEYNGADYHRGEDRKEVDKIKKEFCTKNKLKLVTLQGRDYYHMEQKIKEVLGIK